MSAKRGKVAGAFLGTIVEYYDYSLYGFSAGILANKFFPGEDNLTGLMYVFGIYAIAYFSKPFGALFFSRIGDMYGRRIALRITLIGIALPTITIGLLPEYNSVGAISTAILIICRLLQGFFIAGEYDGAAIYVIEHIGKKYHYTASAITRSTGVAGLLLGIASTSFFNSSLFPDWCWRMPFLLSLPLSLITLYYRKFLEETPEFKESIEHKIKLDRTIDLLKEKFSTIIVVIFLAGGFGATYQISIIFMKQYLPILVPKTSEIIKTISIVMVFVFGSAMPLAGFAADKFGGILVIKASLVSTLVSVCSLYFAAQYGYFNLLLLSCILLAMSIAPFNALAHGVIVKSFPVKMRYRGVSIGHTIGSMLMSGTANVTCITMMKYTGLVAFPLFYIAFFATIACFSILCLAKGNY